MSKTLFLFARITPKPEYFDDARNAVLGIVCSTLDEPGCHNFVLHQGRGDGCLYLYEEWQDQAALDAHHAMPYTSAVFASYKDWLAKPVEITELSRLP